MNDFTIMLPVHRSNLALANDCIQNLLDTSDLPIICIDDFGNDNEYIKIYFDYPSKNMNYPTIDHRISKYFGFLNNIPPEEIYKIENLCFAERWINSAKNSKLSFD